MKNVSTSQRENSGSVYLQPGGPVWKGMESEGTHLRGGEMLEGLLLPTDRREGCVLIHHSQPRRGRQVFLSSVSRVCDEEEMWTSSAGSHCSGKGWWRTMHSWNHRRVSPALDSGTQSCGNQKRTEQKHQVWTCEQFCG